MVAYVSGHHRVLRRALILGGACVAALAIVYLLAVWTAPGQRFEDAVLRAADQVAGGAEQTHALHTLDAITGPSVVAAMILVLIIGALRHRIFLGLLSVGTIIASIATTEAIQHFGRRPILLDYGYRREDQSFPSGHTAVAMSLMCALIMVVPYRFRGSVVFLTAVWAGSVSVATVTASWHRPSDTIGAGLIVVGYACAAVAVLARWGRVREAALRTPVGRVLRGSFTGSAVLAFMVAAAVTGVALVAFHRGHTGAAVLLAGRSLAVSVSAAAAVTMLALLRHVDLGARAVDPAEEGSPDVEPRHAGVYRPSGS